MRKNKGTRNGQNTRKVTDFSRRNGNNASMKKKFGQKLVLRTWKSFVKHLFSPLMARNDFLRVISIPCPAVRI